MWLPRSDPRRHQPGNPSASDRPRSPSRSRGKLLDGRGLSQSQPRPMSFLPQPHPISSRPRIAPNTFTPRGTQKPLIARCQLFREIAGVRPRKRSSHFMGMGRKLIPGDREARRPAEGSTTSRNLRAGGRRRVAWGFRDPRRLPTDTCFALQGAYREEGWAEGVVLDPRGWILAEPNYRTPARGTSVNSTTRFSTESGR
jgi:hypothetical protein